MLHASCYIKHATKFYFRLFDSGVHGALGYILHIHRASHQSILVVFKVVGASSEAGTPDPIPNSAVKRFSVDGSLRARVDQCQLL
jgi:hypothetical protein